MTLRQHLEAIRDRNTCSQIIPCEEYPDDPQCPRCQTRYDAEAALRLITCPPGEGPGLSAHTWPDNDDDPQTCLVCGSQRGTSNGSAS